MSAHSQLTGLIHSLFTTPRYRKGEFAALTLPLLPDIPHIVLGTDTGRFEAMRQCLIVLGGAYQRIASKMDLTLFCHPDMKHRIETNEYNYSIGPQHEWAINPDDGQLRSYTVPPYIGKLMYLMELPEAQDPETARARELWISALIEIANVLALWDAYSKHKEFFEARKGRFVCIYFAPTYVYIA
jgi:hypothetical protein